MAPPRLTRQPACCCLCPQLTASNHVSSASAHFNVTVEPCRMRGLRVSASAAGSGPNACAGAGRPRAGGLGSRGGLPVVRHLPQPHTPFRMYWGRGPFGGGAAAGRWFPGRGLPRASRRCRGSAGAPRLLTAPHLADGCSGMEEQAVGPVQASVLRSFGSQTPQWPRCWWSTTPRLSHPR